MSENPGLSTLLAGLVLAAAAGAGYAGWRHGVFVGEQAIAAEPPQQPRPLDPMTVEWKQRLGTLSVAKAHDDVSMVTCYFVTGPNSASLAVSCVKDDGP